MSDYSDHQGGYAFARKRFGQHFLHDPQVIARIIALIRPLPQQHLLEIGPGRGALTRPLLRAAQRLEAIELDRDLIPQLRHYCQGIGELQVYPADALTFDFARLRRDQRLLRVVGNLPYNIATPLLFHLLAQASHLDDMHFMLQKEVVERMVASANASAYGRLSVMVQYRCQVECLFTIGRGAFRPPPKVESAFVRLRPYRQPLVAVRDEACFRDIVRCAFSRRRKTLRNALRPLLSAQAMAAVGIDPQARPETLALPEFALLADALALCRDAKDECDK